MNHDEICGRRRNVAHWAEEAGWRQRAVWSGIWGCGVLPFQWRRKAVAVKSLLEIPLDHIPSGLGLGLSNVQPKEKSFISISLSETPAVLRHATKSGEILCRPPFFLFLFSFFFHLFIYFLQRFDLEPGDISFAWLQCFRCIASCGCLKVREASSQSS